MKKIISFELANILTEFDDSISSEINIDPLGMLVIWSAFGQDIFRRRVSSISNDVRNYTLNLFNHAVTRSLIQDESIVLPKSWQFGSQRKNSLAFKRACLIYLENLFTYSILEAEQQEKEPKVIQAAGVLGISKARRQWEEKKSGATLKLLFSDKPEAHLLVRQPLLGVSGRYKTPLVEMGFFNSGYDYDLPGFDNLWLQAEESLFNKGCPLSNLLYLAKLHIAKLLKNNPREHFFGDCSTNFKTAFVTAFSSPKAVGKYAKEFWLAVTELNQGAAGALYKEVNKDRNSSSGERSIEKIFAAASKSNITDDDKDKLNNVIKLEPFLAEMDLLMNVMLSAKSQTVKEACEKWKVLGREANTLSKLIAGDEIRGIQSKLTGTAAIRLKTLIGEVASQDGVAQQMRALLKYHEGIMSNRGQSPWLRLIGNEFKVDVRIRKLPKKEERPIGTWVNHYYIPQFRHLLSGLEGEAV